MRKFAFLVAAVGATLCGCIVTSIHPLFTDKDVVFEPKLIGTWTEPDRDPNSKEAWKFEKADNAYKLIISNRDGVAEPFDAHLVKLGTNLFFDIFPSEEISKDIGDKHDMAAGFFIRTHGIASVLQMEPSLKLAFFSPDKLEKYFQQHPTALKHEIEDKQMVLTASTKELQAFSQKHARDTNLLTDPLELKRNAGAK